MISYASAFAAAFATVGLLTIQTAPALVNASHDNEPAHVETCSCKRAANDFVTIQTNECCCVNAIELKCGSNGQGTNTQKGCSGSGKVDCR